MKDEKSKAWECAFGAAHGGEPPAHRYQPLKSKEAMPPQRRSLTLESFSVSRRLTAMCGAKGAIPGTEVGAEIDGRIGWQVTRAE